MDRLDSLRLFVEIAEAGSFSAVARNRHLSASTVTLAVQQLEDSVGARLITRSTRKLAFTHEGERFLQDARRMLAGWEIALGRLREDGPLQGPIHFTATTDFGRHTIVPLVDEFMALHPGVSVTVMLTDSVVDLLEGQLDFGLRSGPLRDSGLKARLLVQGPRLICASPSYWEAHGRPAHPRDLLGHNCLVLGDPGGGPLSAWRFIVDGEHMTLKVHGNRVANDGSVLRHWGLQGHGVIAKNRWDIRSELESGRLEAILEDCVCDRVDLYAVYAGDALSRRVAALIDFLAGRIR
ncbi:MAG: LysR family transcriptional regulator [Burkholderiaceae bacterium]